MQRLLGMHCYLGTRLKSSDFRSLARYKSLLLMAKWLEKELMRKDKWRPGGDEFDYGYGMNGK